MRKVRETSRTSGKGGGEGEPDEHPMILTYRVRREEYSRSTATYTRVDVKLSKQT